MPSTDPVCAELHEANQNSNPNIISSSAPLNVDLPCENETSGNMSALSKKFDNLNIGSTDVVQQTGQDSGCIPKNQISLSELSPENNTKHPLEQCPKKCIKPQAPRNCIIGYGLGGDGVGGIKVKEPKSRQDGNPLTGEGYKSDNLVSNKTGIPPGGFFWFW